MRDSTIEQCEQGHTFVKLPDHPTRYGLSRCPYCMAVGLDAARKKNEAQLDAILTFIDEGSDELLVRRIWERALRA